MGNLSIHILLMCRIVTVYLTIIYFPSLLYFGLIFYVLHWITPDIYCLCMTLSLLLDLGSLDYI